MAFRGRIICAGTIGHKRLLVIHVRRGERKREMNMTSLIKHPFLALMMFLAGYFTTVTLKANAQDTLVTGDAIQLNENHGALVTGKIVNVDDTYFDMESNGKQMRVFLKDVKLRQKASSVLSKGMNVTVRGTFHGEEFGRMLMDAENVVASASPSATIMDDNGQMGIGIGE